QQPFMVSCTTLDDTVKPSGPSPISGTSSVAPVSPTATTVSLTWSAGTDDYQVAGYQVFRGSTLIATVGPSTLTYTDTGLSPWTNYTYTVKAVDPAGNVSTTGGNVTVQTKDVVAPTKPLSLNA